MISFPVTDITVRSAVTRVHHMLAQACPSLVPACIDLSNLHVPLVKLVLDSRSQIGTARTALHHFQWLLPCLLEPSDADRRILGDGHHDVLPLAHAAVHTVVRVGRAVDLW